MVSTKPSALQQWIRRKRATGAAEVQARPTLNTLPLELQEYIVVEFMRNPYTTLEDLKTLRLVCKSLDAICLPRVLVRVWLFQLPREKPIPTGKKIVVGGGMEGADVWEHFRQLLSVISSRPSNRLSTVETFVIPIWHWMYEDTRFISFKRMRQHSVVLGMLWNVFACPVLYTSKFVCSPKILPMAAFRGCIRMGAKLCLSFTRKLPFLNVRRVQWGTSADDSRSLKAGIIRWLLKLPQLTDLSLAIAEDDDFNYVFQRLSGLRHLTNLTISFYYEMGRNEAVPIDALGKFIAANPKLTSLDLYQSGRMFPRADIPSVFDHIPADCPLKLDHLGVSDNFKGTPAVLRQIRSLKSFCEEPFSKCDFPVLQLLHRENLFPPVIGCSLADDALLNYIGSHPGIISLHVDHRETITGRKILRLLPRHSATLVYFRTSGLNLCQCLVDVDNELDLLACKNLRQLVLEYPAHVANKDSMWGSPNNDKLCETKLAMGILARLESLSTLVIDNLYVFEECVRHCREDDNPLVRKFVERIVYDINPKIFSVEDLV